MHEPRRWSDVATGTCARTVWGDQDTVARPSCDCGARRSPPWRCSRSTELAQRGPLRPSRWANGRRFGAQKRSHGVLGGCECGCVVHGRRHVDIGEESEIEAAVSVGVRCARAGPRISSASGTLPPPRVPARALRPRIKTQKLIFRQKMGRSVAETRKTPNLAARDVVAGGRRPRPRGVEGRPQRRAS